jgi:myo-inositol-1-phosphate synthase
MCQEIKDVNTTSEALLNSIKQSHKEISPSTIYAVASIMEGCSFINGSPQNTILTGVIQLAEERGVFVVGNDFKSGQTKFKTAFTDFLIQAGIKPKAIVSYNHLGNNDGKNLSSEEQFKSKEKSKSSCVDDMLYSNTTLFKEGETIDHTIVIKYVPSTGDTKKALDEYTSEIFMGGQHVLECYNVCEDSLLAAPLIIDLILLTELFERIEVRVKGEENYHRFDSVLDCLGYLLKAPLTKQGLPVINSLNRQRNCIENILKVCAGIPLESNLLLERRVEKKLKEKPRSSPGLEAQTKVLYGTETM